MESGRFENSFIKIPHPIRNGDFVKIKNNSHLEDDVCIVECFNIESDESTSEQYSASYDYEADPKYGLLYCAQSLVLGRGGLNDLQLLCDEYRTRRRFKSSDEE